GRRGGHFLGMLFGELHQQLLFVGFWVLFARPEPGPPPAKAQGVDDPPQGTETEGFGGDFEEEGPQMWEGPPGAGWLRFRRGLIEDRLHLVLGRRVQVAGPPGPRFVFQPREA